MFVKVRPGRKLTVSGKDNILNALLRHRLPVQNVCNGKGTCGKCKVKVLEQIPFPSKSDLKHLSEAELNQGVRLACTLQPIDGMELELPDQVSFDRKETLLLRTGEVKLDSGLRKITLCLARPSLEDEMGDWDRLREHIIRETQLSLTEPSHILLQKLASTLRSSDYKITAVLYGDKLIDIEPGDTTEKLYGIGVDIGTTSVAVALVDFNTGEIIKIASAENGQTAFGADVISRITFARSSRANHKRMRTAVKQTVNKLLRSLLREVRISAKHIYKMTMVGNTTMHHLFLGLEVSQLAVSPFVSVINSTVVLSAGELGIGINPGARVMLFPNIGGFVGGDTVGAVVGAPEVFADGNHLLVDLGTNCELFLKTPTETLACSTAAGPAFEGAGITHGMRAKPGAIEGVRITETDVEVKVIGLTQATGICGSGLVEAIHQMLLAGVINAYGKITDPAEDGGIAPYLRERIRQGQHGREFVLSQGPQDVVINQKDISQLQLAKGAVCAGIKTITEMADLRVSDLDSVILAGTFASYLNIESIIAIGLVPNIPQHKIRAVGNAAHVGAIKALINKGEFAKAIWIGESAQHIELGGNQKFSYYFMENMCLEPTT